MIYDNLSSIVCVDMKLGIGRKGDIPWLDKYWIDFFSPEVILKYVKLDLKHFKKTRRLYNYLVVGSKTFNTLPYISQDFIVLTNNKDKVVNNVNNNIIAFTNDFLDELECNKSFDILCIGGESIYNQLLPCSRYLYLSQWKNTIWGCDKFINKEHIEMFKEIEIIFEDDDFKISKLKNESNKTN